MSGQTSPAFYTEQVNPAVLTVKANDISIMYGQPVTDDYTITGFQNGDLSTVVTGAPSMDTPATMYSPLGPYPVTVALGTLATTSNYSFNFVPGTLTIIRATPTLQWNPPAAITYGYAIWAAQLSASAGNSGTFTYNPPTGTVLPAGLQTLTATFTPKDIVDYYPGTISVTVNVKQAIPTITWGIPAAIPVNTALSARQLNASSSAPGTFTYLPPIGTVMTTGGANTLTAMFTPTDSNNYAPAVATVIQTVVDNGNPPVTKTSPVITWPTPPAITAGTPLGAGQLNATSSVPGTFTYSPTAGTVLGVGTQILEASFTPTDTTHYNVAGAMVELTVKAAPIVPVITWPTPTPITYGTSLWSGQLNATANVAGTFTYTPALGTILPVGTQTLSVLFTPTSNAYTSQTATVQLVVNPIIPAINWPTPAAIPYGTALWSLQLNATASVPGTFTYTPAAGTVLNIGTRTLTAVFTPTSSNYATQNISVPLVVTQISPVITWPAPASISYGTSLWSAQLDASANVPGVLTYTPPAGTFLDVGTQTLSVSFVPTDGVHYANATATTTLVVTASNVPIVKTSPVVTWSTPVPITYGTALGSAQLNATSSVPGTFSYSPAPGTVLPVGSQVLVVAFTPIDTVHYNVAGSSVMMTVNPALIAPKITWNQPAAITYGTSLWAMQLNATANVPGTFVYSPASGTVLQPGTQTLTVTFNPTNPAYSQQTATVPIVVNQVVSVLKWNTPSTMTSGTALWGAQLDASASVPGTFAYTPAAGTVLTTGTYTLSATFTPSDPVHYTGGTITTVLTVK
jgi:hypothetical protein